MSEILMFTFAIVGLIALVKVSQQVILERRLRDSLVRLPGPDVDEDGYLGAIQPWDVPDEDAAA